MNKFSKVRYTGLLMLLFGCANSVVAAEQGTVTAVFSYKGCPSSYDQIGIRAQADFGFSQINLAKGQVGWGMSADKLWLNCGNTKIVTTKYNKLLGNDDVMRHVVGSASYKYWDNGVQRKSKSFSVNFADYADGTTCYFEFSGGYHTHLEAKARCEK